MKSRIIIEVMLEVEHEDHEDPTDAVDECTYIFNSTLEGMPFTDQEIIGINRVYICTEN